MNDKLREALEKIKDGLTWGQDSDVLIGIAEKALAASKPEPLYESCVSVAMSPCQFSGICKYCKPEPQAQAEPEVVAWINQRCVFKADFAEADAAGHEPPELSFTRYGDFAKSQALITLQSHREAMAQVTGHALALAGELQRLRAAIKDKGGDEHSPTQWAYDQACRVIRERDEAIAKKDAALDACALPESYTGGTCLSYPGRRAEVTLHFSSIEDADRWFAAITSTKDTP